MKSLVRNLVLAATSAFALLLATPAQACGGDCDDCPHRAASKVDRKAAAPAPANAPAAPATAAEKCQCEKGGKGCTCPPGKCDCANCGKAKKGA